MRIFVALSGLSLCLSVLAGCELFHESEDEPLDYTDVKDIRYAQHVQPLLNQKCTGCHAGTDAAAGLRLDSWENLIKGSDHGEAVIPFDASGSLLVRLATKLAPPHPAALGADTLTGVEIDFLARWIDEGAKNDAGEVPYADTEDLLYVCNQDEARISIIDAEANVVVRTLRLADYGFPPNAQPHHVAVEPDGSFWYVTLIGAGKVLKFDHENELVGQVDLETPGMLALHPMEDLLYVSRSMSAVSPPSSIGVIRRSDMTMVEEIPVVFPKPHAISVRPEGDYAYTASVNENQLITIRTDNSEVRFTPVAGPPHGFVQHAISPDGQTMFLSSELINQVQVFDLSNPAAPVFTKGIDVDAAPWDPMFTPDGRFLYVGNNKANTVTVIDAEARAVTDVIAGEGLAQPHGIGFSADGRFVYVTNRNTQGGYTPRYDLSDNARAGTVVVIDAATNEIVKVLEVGRYASGIGMRAHGMDAHE